MSLPLLLAAAIRLSIWAGLIAQIVFCDDVGCRMLWGGGSLIVVAPVMIWQANRQATKTGKAQGIEIGRDIGETKATAQMLREHFRLQDTDID